MNDFIEYNSIPWMREIANISLSDSSYVSIKDWLFVAFKKYMLENSITLYEKHCHGKTKDVEGLTVRVAELTKTMKLASVTLPSKTTAENRFDEDADLPGRTCLYYSMDTVVYLNFGNEHNSSILICYGNNEKKVNTISKNIEKYMNPETTEDGNVYMLEMTNSGIEISYLGEAKEPLIKDNYSSLVQKQYEYIKNEISKKNPGGRLTIINGPPGTGKTFLIRALINDVKGCSFILVPSSQIGLLSNSTFMPRLREFHSEEGKPIIFIFEDADNALIPREGRDMSIISDVLNLTDGVAGSILDVRIIATTNAKKIEIESALLRKRRLSCNMMVGNLSEKEANRVYNRLSDDCPNGRKFNGPITLADIYYEADPNKAPDRENDDKKSTLGF